MNFERYSRLDELAVALMASAPIGQCACPLPYDQDCSAQRCWSCHATLLEIVNWCHRNVRDRHGQWLARLYVRRALLNDVAIWNVVRRGHLDRRRVDRPRADRPIVQPRVVVVVSQPVSVLAENCTICLEAVMRGQEVYLPCTHSYHSECINRWLQTQRTCPICRVPF